MPKKEIIRVERMAATNPNLSLATRFGNLVFVAGQTGRHPVTGELGKDIREQTRNVLERIKMILAAAGTSLDNVLTVTTHLTKREDLAPYNEEYGRYFPTTSRPDYRGGDAELAGTPRGITVTACIPIEMGGPACAPNRRLVAGQAHRPSLRGRQGFLGIVFWALARAWPRYAGAWAVRAALSTPSCGSGVPRGYRGSPG
jgi:enamine deaminase RidA (YjgF/YER057c/UK114 family)